MISYLKYLMLILFFSYTFSEVHEITFESANPFSLKDIITDIDNIFLQMLELELYLKKKYPKINYNILYFNFFEHKIPKESNIINIVLNTNITYNKSKGSPFEKLREYCGEILSIIFKSEFKCVLINSL